MTATSNPAGPGNALATALRPAINEDNAYFWEGLAVGELRIQRCASCGMLRHPSSPGCAFCRSLDWGYVAAAGTGRLHSVARVHQPLLAPFLEPYWVAVVELTEGVRLATQLTGFADETPEIGEPVGLRLITIDDQLTLPFFALDRP